jgi:hypothetical protein
MRLRTRASLALALLVGACHGGFEHPDGGADAQLEDDADIDRDADEDALVVLSCAEVFTCWEACPGIACWASCDARICAAGNGDLSALETCLVLNCSFPCGDDLAGAVCQNCIEVNCLAPYDRCLDVAC